MKKYLPAIIAVILIIAVGAAAYVMGSEKAEKPAGTETAMSQQDQGTLPDVSTDGRTPQLKGIAVVDVVALMRTSNAARSIEEQLNAKRKSYQEELAGQEKKLRAMEEELVKDPKKGSPEFNEKRKKFESSVRDLQKNAQQKRISLDKAAGKAIGKMQEEITKITAEIANAKNLQMVLTREQVVIVSKPLDITVEVMDKLNQQLSSVPVNVVAVEAPTADSKK